MKLSTRFHKALMCVQFGLLGLSANAIAQYHNPYNNPYNPPSYGHHQDINQKNHHVQVIERPNATVLMVDVNQELPRGMNTIRLKKMFKLRNYHGQAIKRVAVIGSSARGHGQVELLVNGYSTEPSKTMGMQQTRAVFQMYENQSVLGQDIRRLQLKTQGKIYIKTIRIALEKNRIQTISKPLYKTVYGSETIPLRRELGLTPAQANGHVKLHSVSVSGQPKMRGGALVQLMVNGSPVGYPQRITRLNSQLTFQMPHYSDNVLGQDLRRVQLQVTGNAQITHLSAQIEELSGYGSSPAPLPPVIDPIPGPGPGNGGKCGPKKKKKGNC